jgi:hypothetical protein
LFFSFDLTVAANTLAGAPVKLTAQLPPGTIHRVEVQFPTGCVGLVHTAAFRGAHQVWPTNDSFDLASDGWLVAWDDEYDLDAAPFSLELRARSDDDTYTHVVTWRLAMRKFAPDLQAQLEAVQAAGALSTLEVPT